MCRLLAVCDADPFEMHGQLRALATIARTSREYQGDGWGCAWWDGQTWQRYRSLTPIWEDRLDRFGETRLLLAHARSAFRNEGIAVEHNMPFIEDEVAFVFNGELRGVRLAAPGRTGADKLFHMLRRLGAARDAPGLRRAVDIVARRTSYVRAMNVVMAHRGGVRVVSRFGEDPDYFTMHVKREGTRLAICSEPFPPADGWLPIANGSVLEFQGPC
jgi:predicted glutamine amidotransferase